MKHLVRVRTMPCQVHFGAFLHQAYHKPVQLALLAHVPPLG